MQSKENVTSSSVLRCCHQNINYLTKKMFLFSPLMSEIVKQNMFCQFCSLYLLFCLSGIFLPLNVSSCSALSSNLFSLFLNRWGIYSFPIAAITNLVILSSDLPSCSSGGQKLKMSLSDLKFKVLSDYVSSGGCR